MRAYYRIERKIDQNGKLLLQMLPFKAGENVEVIILSNEDKKSEIHHLPLKGKIIQYDNHFEPVAKDDWEVLKWFSSGIWVMLAEIVFINFFQIFVWLYNLVKNSFFRIKEGRILC